MKFLMHSNNIHSTVNEKSLAVFIYQAVINKLSRLRMPSSGNAEAWTNHNIQDQQHLKETDRLPAENIQIPAHVNSRTWRRHSALLSNWEEQRRH